MAGHFLKVKSFFRKFSRFLGELRRRMAVKPVGVGPGRLRVLVLGVYLNARENSAKQLIEEFSSSKLFDVVQRWVSIDSVGVGVGGPLPCTVETVAPGRPKFEIINNLLSSIDLGNFDYVLISDDDIYIPRGFIDAFITRQVYFGFSIAQPARTLSSYVDHRFVIARPWLEARETRFVEIGPIFCIAKHSFSLIFPFDLKSPMGWGYDLVWPIVMAENGLSMGIVDAVPVAHTMRPRGDAYSSEKELSRMREFLSGKNHIGAKDAFVSVKRHVRFMPFFRRHAC